LREFAGHHYGIWEYLFEGRVDDQILGHCVIATEKNQQVNQAHDW
jgi:hypothetical protein